MTTLNATQDECAVVYERYFAIPMEPGFYIKWVREFPHNRTLVQFENSILNSTAFKRYIEKHVETVYKEWIHNAVPKTVATKFFEELYTEQKIKQAPTPLQVMMFVKSLPEFYEKYTSIIKRLYKIVNQEDIPEQVLQMYMDKIKDFQNVYSLQQLNEDIICGRGPSAKPTQNIMRFITETWCSVHGTSPTSQDVNELFEIASDTQKTLQSLIMYRCSSQNSRLYRIMNAFIAVFQRECTVYEFIKWENKMKTIEDAELTHWLTETYEQHRQHLATVRSLYQKYHNIAIEELLFIKEYLNLVDQLEWEDIIIDRLIASPVYDENMRSSIRTIYESLYNTRISGDDEDHMFLEMKSLRIDLKNQAVTDTIVRVKEDTDDIISRLDTVFDNVLKRMPDEMEVRDYKKLYRAQKTCDKTDTDREIETQLYNSLEYHDILKNLIRDAFVKKSQKPPLPSQLYGVLNKILQDEILMRSPASILDLV
jgi:hypothetical protein